MQLAAVQAVTPYHIHGQTGTAFPAESEAPGLTLLLARLERGVNRLEQRRHEDACLETARIVSILSL